MWQMNSNDASQTNADTAQTNADNFLFGALSGAILACFYHVYDRLGFGFLERWVSFFTLVQKHSSKG